MLKKVNIKTAFIIMRMFTPTRYPNMFLKDSKALYYTKEKQPVSNGVSKERLGL